MDSLKRKRGAREVTTVTPVTPRHDYSHAAERLGVHAYSIKRYLRELKAQRVSLFTGRGGKGQTLLSDATLRVLEEFIKRKAKRAQAGRSATQSERIARYAAALGGRREAEVLKRQLSAVEGGVRRRVAALLWHAPQVASLGARGRVLAYLWLWHSTDLDALPDEAPWVGTIERAFRAVVADT